MKTIISILFAVFIIQVVINITLVYCYSKPYTLRELFQKLSNTHWIVWIPVIGFVVQVCHIIYIIVQKIWKIIKILINMILDIRIRS